MDKVYFRKDYPGCWWLVQLTDIFYFKAIDLENKEYQFIFSWTRNCDLTGLPNNPVRRYDIELEGKKYYFLIYPEKDGWLVKSENIIEFDKLSSDNNLLFTGTDLDTLQ